MSSAICFNLDQSKILLSGNELRPFGPRQSADIRGWVGLTLVFDILRLFGK